MMVINTETGEMEFNGIHINKNMKIEDFKKYEGKGLAEITVDLGKGEGVVRLTNKIESNGILAEIKIGILRYGTKIYVYPEIDVGEDLISVGKKWLAGMIVDERIEEYADRICVTYDWGNITAMYMPDRDYGTVGGEIQIAYEDEERDDI